MPFFTRKRKLALVAALTLTGLAGCVGRKQYQINEAILISERRQLEDDIYRLQFELRDALEENERLRGELGDDGDESGGRARTKKIESARGTTDLFAAQTRPLDRANGGAVLYPGADALQVERTEPNANGSATANAEQFRDSQVAPSTGGQVETLPDYVPIPLSSNAPTPTPSRPNAKQLGVRRDVAASNYVANAAATPNRVEQTTYRNNPAAATVESAASDAETWSPFPR